MKTHANESRLLWLVCGVIGGLCLAYFWPHEELRASATDHSDKFAICTVEVGPLLPEAVFVLNFANGELKGAMLNNQAGMFTNFWFTNVFQDFELQGKGDKKYAMIPGQGWLNQNPQAGGGGTAGTGLIYIGELSSGKVGCYRFHYMNAIQPMPPIKLEQVAMFSFREDNKAR